MSNSFPFHPASQPVPGDSHDKGGKPAGPFVRVSVACIKKGRTPLSGWSGRDPGAFWAVRLRGRDDIAKGRRQCGNEYVLILTMMVTWVMVIMLNNNNSHCKGIIALLTIIYIR